MKVIKYHPKSCIAVLSILLIICFFFAINIGNIHVSFTQLLKGLFVSYDVDVASVYSIRFPRITIAMLAGGALALSGLLCQVVLKNPLADPGIIGISNGASLASLAIIIFFPQLYAWSPLFSFIGGVATFLIIYTLSWKSGFQTNRIILIGVALSYTISAVMSLLNTSSISLTGSVAGNISLKTWDDATLLAMYIIPIILITLLTSKACNLMHLEDRTLMSLGIRINAYRFVLSMLAVLLCSITVAIAGVISFIGLLVPHMARLLVGNDHKVLIPVNLLLGAIVLLSADTIGRVIMAPYEISSAIVLAIVGGPIFIFLLKRSERLNGNS